jgi:hypothetical protein
MKKVLTCRRSTIAILGIVCLTSLGLYTKDAQAVAIAISTIAVGIAGANAYEKKGSDK